MPKTTQKSPKSSKTGLPAGKTTPDRKKTAAKKTAETAVPAKRTTATKAPKKPAAKRTTAAKSPTKTVAPRTSTAKTTGTRRAATGKTTRQHSTPRAINATGKNLVIVESPAKARTLTGYLGPDYVVQATVGHIWDLPTKRLGVDLEADFEPEYEVISGKEDVVNALKKTATGTRAIYVATDPDREGEAIAWHVAQELGNGKGAKLYRVLFNEITRNGVLQAMAHPTEIDIPKVDAQTARRVLDRLVGYMVSPLLAEDHRPRPVRRTRAIRRAAVDLRARG